MFKNMTAKEIFELLGYELVEKDKEKIVYEKELLTEYDAQCLIRISFHLDSQYYDASIAYHYIRSGHESKDGAAVSMQLLAAINKQVEELGWLNEQIR